AEERRRPASAQADGRGERGHGRRMAGRHAAHAEQALEIHGPGDDHGPEELEELHGTQGEDRQDQGRIPRHQLASRTHRSRSTAKRASASSTGSLSDAARSASTARSISWRARTWAASSPRSAGYVAFCWSRSLPAVLPSTADAPVTSRMSSVIWNASPSARP